VSTRFDGPADDSAPVANQPRRPILVWLLSLLLVLFGLVWTLMSIGLISELNDDHPYSRSGPGWYWVLAALALAVAVAQSVSGLSLFSGQEWARMVGMAVCGLNALGAVAMFVTTGDLQTCLTIAAHVGIIFGLNRYEVVDWCRS